MKAKLIAQFYQLDPTITDPFFHWIPKENGHVEEDFEYDESASDLENAEILSARIKKIIKRRGATRNFDPHPVTAFFVDGDSWFGTEVFYQCPNATMKISASVLKSGNMDIIRATRHR